MTELARLPGRVVLTAWVLLIFATGGWAQAQDDDEPADNVIAQQAFIVGEQYFNQVVFGGKSAEMARAGIERILTLRINDVDRKCDLSDLQRDKLQLAGQGDIKRLFDRVEEKRKQMNVRFDQNQYAQFALELRKLQVNDNVETFGAGSIFSKTLTTVLTQPQAALYQEGTQDTALFRHRARIERVVAMLDDAMGLSEERRRRLETLLVAETRPPKKNGPYDQYVVLLQAARLPEARIRPIFDESEWRHLIRMFESAKRLEPFLISQGVLPDEAATGPEGNATQ